MSNVLAFPIRRITTASFVDSVMRSARQLRDDRLAREQQAMPVPSGSVAPGPGAFCADGTGAAAAGVTAHPDRSAGGRRTSGNGDAT